MKDRCQRCDAEGKDQGQCYECKHAYYEKHKDRERARGKAWYYANKAYVREKNREWQRAHRAMLNEKQRVRSKNKTSLQKQRVLELNRAYRKRNPEANRIATAKWRAKNLERHRAMIRAWGRKNRERNVVRSANRRAKVRLWNGVTKADWASIKNKYKNRCAYCKKKKFLTMDHVIPLSRGGPHEPSNIVPACKSCNCRKHNMDAMEFANRNGQLL